MRNKIIFKLLVLLLLYFSGNNIYSQQPSFFYQNPYPTGSTLQDIEFFNNNTAVTCGDYGAILRTNNNGLNWSIVYVGFDNSFSDISIIDSLKGFIVGSRGKLIKTTNSGSTWETINAFTYLNLNSIYFVNSNSGYISADSGVVFKTINGGLNWTRIFTGVNTILRKVKFLNSNTGIVVGNSGKILRTSNSGLNWDSKYSSNKDTFMDLDNIDSLNVFVVGWDEVIDPHLGTIPHGVLLKTSDSGLNWTNINYSSYQYYYSINLLNNTTGFITGNNIFKSTQSGYNWAMITPNFINNSIINGDKVKRITIIDSSNLIFTATRGIIGTTSNQGTSWIQRIPTSNITSDLLQGLYFINENTGFIVGGGSTSTYSQVILKTTNGGTNWNIIQSNATNMYLNCIQMVDNNTGYIGGGNDYFYKTTNGGNNWLYSNVQMFRGTEDMHFFDANTGLIVGGQNGTSSIKYTTNGGVSWENRNSGLQYWVYGLDFVDQNTGYISCQSGKIFKTTNRGINWTQQSTGSNEYLYDIKFANAYTGYACGSNGYLYKTIDGGVNWVLLLTNATSYIYKIQVFNPNTIAVLCRSEGVLYSQDGGNSFNTIRTSETLLKNMFFVNNDICFIIGWKGLIMKSTSGGFVWVNLSNQTVPEKYFLSQNYPNPFNPITKIKFDVTNGFPIKTFGNDKVVDVKLVVYDVMGREVQTLVNERLQPGTYETSFDGSALNSGVYFYKMVTDGFTETKRMILIK